MAVADGFFDGDEDFVSQEQENREYELFADFDAKREAYGDPCPGCGRLRGGGDCWYCLDESDGRGEGETPDSEAPVPTLEAPVPASLAKDEDGAYLLPDDIPF